MKKIDPSQIKKGGIYAIVSSFGAFDKVFAAAGDALGSPQRRGSKTTR